MYFLKPCLKKASVAMQNVAVCGIRRGYDLATYLLHQSSPICFIPIFELPRSAPSCLYFRPKCVNLPKSLRYNNFFS